MKEIDVDELKKIQIGILDFIDGFCSSHEIKYYLTGGTLIGAIRHKGYIPWDDDIDICMMREDYDKFIELLREANNPTYKVYSHTFLKDYPAPYAKVINNNTVLIENTVFPYAMGVFIDVFPLDTIPLSKKLQKRLYNKFNMYYGMLQMKQIKWNTRRKLVKNLFIEFSRLILKLIPISYIVNKMHNNAIQYKDMDSPLCGDVVWGYGIREITKREFFENTILAEFEGKKYSIPQGYDMFLKGLYGDYMQLPPVEKRRSTHGFKAYWKD